jgi:adenylate cyclase
MRAVFLAALDAPGREVEAEFAHALQTARDQGARSLELRAATSLLDYRLRHGDGPTVDAARARLAAVLAGFSEGQDTPAPREAAALLTQT